MSSNVKAATPTLAVTGILSLGSCTAARIAWDAAVREAVTAKGCFEPVRLCRTGRRITAPKDTLKC
jgi:dienelactone hydrolase